jgi:hypothetical protein
LINQGQLFLLGTPPHRFSFTLKLNVKLNPQNIYVYSFGDWFKKGLTDESNFASFATIFSQAAQRAAKIHFNLEGIENPMDYASSGAGGFGDSNYFTAAELYTIKNNPILCQKTDFYDDGNKSLVPSQSKKILICGVP